MFRLYKKFALSLILVLCLIVFLVPDTAYAQGVGAFLKEWGKQSLSIVSEQASSMIGTVAETAYKITLYVVFAVSSVILKLVGFLTLSFISIVDGILCYSDFTSNETVQIGWSIVRDICNMFFIVVLLIIVLCYFGVVYCFCCLLVLFVVFSNVFLALSFLLLFCYLVLCYFVIVVF